MEHSLYQMVSDCVDPASVAAFWVPRLAELLDRFMAVRGQVAGQNFIDVRYADLLGNPIDEGVRVLEAAGIDVTDAVRAGMAEWIEANKREDRAPHKYALEDFGLDRSDVERRFAAYRAAFLGGE